MNVENKIIKHFAEKKWKFVQSCVFVLNGAPLNKLSLLLRKYLFKKNQNLYKMHLLPFLVFFSQENGLMLSKNMTFQYKADENQI